MKISYPIPEIALWRSVIFQAAREAYGLSCTAQEKTNAKAWFKVPRKSFWIVCDFAQLDPEFTRAHILVSLKNRDLFSIKKMLRVT